MSKIRSVSSVLLLLAGGACGPTGEPVEDGHPATSDPRGFEAADPPRMVELALESEGSKLNGLAYVAAGRGPHATVILLHGYPGNERNLDLAQAIRRAGMNVVYFNYRGSWGSGGRFSLTNALEDTRAATAFVGDDDTRQVLRGDGRVALVGHSFGGLMGLMAMAAEPEISCLAFLAGANLESLGRVAASGPEGYAAVVAALGEAMDADGGPIKADPDTAMQDLMEQFRSFDLPTLAASLAGRPLLVVAGARDRTAPKEDHHDPVIAALRGADGARVTELVLDDDHYFSAHRVELSRRLVDWLRQDCWPGG